MELLLERSDSRCPLRGKCPSCHLPTTPTAMSSHILFSKDRWEPEALGRAGVLRGQGHGGRAPVASLPPPSPSGVNLQPQFMPVLEVPQGLRGSASGLGPASSQRERPRWPGSHCAGGCPAEPGGWGGCDYSGTQTPDIPFWGLQKGSQTKCEEVSESPEETSRPFQKFYLW